MVKSNLSYSFNMFGAMNHKYENRLIVTTEKAYDAIKKDYLNFLTREEIEQFHVFRTAKRKKSFLLGRFAGKEALSYFLNENAKNRISINNGILNQPIVKHQSSNTPEISITHIDNIVVVMAYETGLLIGIDLESINAKKRGYFDILNKGEKKLLSSLNLYNNLGCTLLWSVKEAISKAIKTGFTVDTSIFSVEKIEVLDNNCYQIKFNFFNSFTCYTIAISNQIIFSIALLRKIKFDFSKHGPDIVMLMQEAISLIENDVNN